MKNLLPCGIVVWALAGGLVGCRPPINPPPPVCRMG